MHESGYTHNDLKLGNIMINGEDFSEIVLIDYGYAKKYIDSDKNHKEVQLM